MQGEGQSSGRQQPRQIPGCRPGLVGLDGHDGHVRRAYFLRQADGYRDLPVAACRSVEAQAPPAQPRHPVGPVIHQPGVLSGLNQ